jgi:chlorobactene glucosyltransferase
LSIRELLLALPWAAPFLAFLRLARRTPSLTGFPPETDGPPLSVIVPARNEARVIETVVRTVLASAYPRLELIVVDDRSTDATAGIVERIAREDGRLRLLRGAELPAGWYGKPWACVQGARAATGDLLLFTDADTRHTPELIPRAVAALLARRDGLVTVAPLQRCVSFWERVVMPQVWLLLGVRYHPLAVNRARRPRDVIANGQFILTTRAAYDAVGTHEVVRHEVAEDLALAQAYHARGRRVFFVFAFDLMETRMYENLPHIVEGWSKNLYLGGRRSFPDEPLLRALVPLALAGTMVFWLVPPVLLLLSLAGLASAALTAPAALAAAISAAFWMAVCADMRIPPPYGLAYPAGAAVVLYIVARSTWRGARQVEWKGRVYDTTPDRPGPRAP